MPPVRSPLALVPAAALARSVPDALEPLGPPPPALFDLPRTRLIINTFVERLGGTETLIANLLLVPHPSPEMQILLQFALDPQYEAASLGTLCAKAGLSPGDVFAIYKDVLQAKADLLAMQQNTAALPDVLSSLIESATAHTETCGKCRGTGTVVKRRSAKTPNPEPETCAACGGAGVDVIPADREAQKIILDLVGLTKKQAGVVVNTSQTTQVLAGSGQTIAAASLSTDAIAGGLPQLQQAVAGILFGKDAVRKRAPDLPPTPPTSSEVLEGAIVREDNGSTTP